MSTRGYVGRDVLLEFSLQPPSTEVASLTFERLGMCRGKELALSRDTADATGDTSCLLYTSPSPRDRQKSRMPSSA